MSVKVFVDQMHIENPCSVPWDSMVGTEQIRFCEHCNLTVNNISEMTRKEVERLIAKSQGRLCVQYRRTRAGAVQTVSAAQKLHRLTRSVSKVAAGAFSATLAVTGAGISQCTTVAASTVAAALDRSQLLGGTVVGVVKDQAGAIITSATVNLTSDQGVAFYTSVNMSGEFRFEGLAPGNYSLRIEAPGFAANEYNGFYVQENSETRLDQTLEVATIEETVEVESDEQVVSFGGAVAFVAPTDPFIRAAQQDDMEEVTKLIAGRDVNLRDKASNTTALEHAVRNANREMVQLLLAAGAKVNLANESGQTVLMMLDTDATSDLVWDLINAGAKVNSKDKDGDTPLMNAARYNNVDLIRTLLEAGAEVEARNEGKQTAVMQAASEGLVNIIKTLVMAGANINAVDGQGKNALSYALEGEHKAAARLLRTQGGVEIAKVEKGN